MASNKNISKIFFDASIIIAASTAILYLWGLCTCQGFHDYFGLHVALFELNSSEILLSAATQAVYFIAILLALPLLNYIAMYGLAFSPKLRFLFENKSTIRGYKHIVISSQTFACLVLFFILCLAGYNQGEKQAKALLKSPMKELQS